MAKQSCLLRTRLAWKKSLKTLRNWDTTAASQRRPGPGGAAHRRLPGAAGQSAGSECRVCPCPQDPFWLPEAVAPPSFEAERLLPAASEEGFRSTSRGSPKPARRKPTTTNGCRVRVWKPGYH